MQAGRSDDRRMDRLKSTAKFAVGLMLAGLTGAAPAQGSAPVQGSAPATKAAAPAAKPAAKTPPAPAPLRLQTLDSATQTDPFPPVNPKLFTADLPSVASVEGYLHAMLGYDANRIWRVVAIQKTTAVGVSKVTALVSERSPNAKVLSAIFFVLPDGKHLIAPDASGVNPFGVDPFAENRAVLKARAEGPWHGAASKDLLLVEFADLQCPHCKDAQAIMNRLAQDFPRARIVYESFPLTEIHPYAFQAAAYGQCIARQNNDAFFTYAQAVYDTQGALLPDSVNDTLKNAVVKAGLDPAAIATCSTTEPIKAEVNASTALARDIGIDSTPILAVNGRMISVTALPYETLKQLIVYQAGLDGVSAAAAGPGAANLEVKPAR